MCALDALCMDFCFLQPKKRKKGNPVMLWFSSQNMTPYVQICNKNALNLQSHGKNIVLAQPWR